MGVQKGFGRSLLWLCCWLCLFSCTKNEIGKENISEVETTMLYSSTEMEVMELVNEYRSKNHLPKLLLLDEISEQAQKHNLHMVSKNEVCHHFFLSRYAALKERAGARAVGENVGYGYNSAEAVVNAWTKSAEHRKNILGNYTHFGIAIASGKQGKLYFTNIFIRR